MADKELLAVEELMRAVEQCDAQKLASAVQKHIVSEEEFLSPENEPKEVIASPFPKKPRLSPRKRCREDNEDSSGRLEKKLRVLGSKTKFTTTAEETQKQLFADLVSATVMAFQEVVKKVMEVYPEHWDVMLRFLEGILLVWQLHVCV
ncbi:hypothetical protein EON63_22005 [archaeon]|nr:MAG: hypothetical protein EON63_22005 [archaeon]